MKRVFLFTVGFVAVITSVLIFRALRPSTMEQDAYRPPLYSSLHTKMNMVIYQPDGSKTPSDMEAWYVKPDRYRIDMVENKSKSSDICRGNLFITMQKDGQAAIYTPASKESKNRFSRTFGSYKAAEVVEKSNHKARIAGQKIILGRACDVVEFAEMDGYQLTTSIDRETGYMMATTTKNNGKLNAQGTTVAFKLNNNIPDSIFDPEIPKGMLTVRTPFQTEGIMMLMFPLPEKTQKKSQGLLGLLGIEYPSLKNLPKKTLKGELQSILAEDTMSSRKKKLNGLYEFNYVPNRFQLTFIDVKQAASKIKTGSSIKTSFSNMLYDGIEINYIDLKTGDALVMIESANHQDVDPAAVAAQGFDGKILAKTDPFPYSILTWRYNGAYFTLGAVNQTEAELVKIAKSVKLVK